MEIEDKVSLFKELQNQIEELECQRKLLGEEILQMMPKDVATVQLSTCRIRRVERLSIRVAIEMAEQLDAVKIQKVVDRKKIKELYEKGLEIPGVSEFAYLQVYPKKKDLEEAFQEVDL